MRKIFIAGAALMSLISQPAWADRACLEVGQIDNWKAIDDKTLIVGDRFRHKYRLKLIGFCSNLKFHETLAFRSIGGLDISCLERGDQVITHSFATGRETCAISDIAPYTHEMEQADKAAASAAREKRHGD